MAGRFHVTRGVPRALRGIGLAVCCAALAIAGHAAADGDLPAAGPSVLLTVLLAGAGIALADRQRGLAGITATVAGTQLAMHVLLTELAHHDGAAPANQAPSATMIGMHAVATMLTAVLLTGAERAMFVLASVLHWLLGEALLVANTGPTGSAACVLRLPTRAAGMSSLLSLLLRRVHARRGPPVPR